MLFQYRGKIFMQWTTPVPRRKCHMLQRPDFYQLKTDSFSSLNRSFENLKPQIKNVRELSSLTFVLIWNLSKGHKYIIIILYCSKLNNQKKVILSFVLTAQREVFLRGYVKLGIWRSACPHWNCVCNFS